MDEAERLAKFNSVDSIVNIFDCFIENDTAYLVMELLDGQTLKSYLDERGTLPYNEAVSIAVPVLEALKQVHSQGIIHRDISPDNIFLTDDGRVKVLDFGASRYASAISDKSLSIILKYGYAPKEQYTTRGDQGPWSDVYAVGATLYRMLTGKTPDDALERAERDTLIPPSKCGAKLPRNAETAILNALNVDPTRRTRTAEEFQKQLMSTVKVERFADVKGKKPWALPKWVYAVLAGVLGAGAIFAGLLLGGVIRFGAGIDTITSGNVTVPLVVGMTEEDARLKYPLWEMRTVGNEMTAEVPVGCIMEQEPSYGDSVAPGTPIDIIVNSGIETPAGQMPYLRGVTLDEAKRRLEGAQLSVSYEYDRRIKGTYPEAGADYRDGDAVELVVSRGGLLEDVRFDYADSTIELDIRRGRVNVPYSLIPANIEDGKCQIVCGSENEAVATFRDGVFTPKGVGETYITVTVTMRDEFTGNTMTATDRRKVVVTSEAGAATVSPDSPDAIVQFADAAFERAVRRECGFTGVVRNRDVWEVTMLVLNDCGLSDISDAARFRNLKLLDVKNNNIRDISPIAGLTELETLKIAENDISDISALSGLKKLRILEMRKNSITSIEALRGLTALEALGMQYNSIADISPLANLTKLNSLILSDNPITSGTYALGNLTELETLYITKTGIKDISPLANMKKLVTLHALDNGIEDISPLFGIETLKEVTVGNKANEQQKLIFIASHPDCRID